MKKKALLLVIFIALLIFGAVFAMHGQSTPTDTTKTKSLFYKPAKHESPFTSQFAVASSNFWRGVDVGKQAVARIDATYDPVQWLSLGMEAAVVSNQYKLGYGNQVNTRVGFNIYNTTIGIQDVYFNITEATPNDTAFFVTDKANTRHFVEGYFKYMGDDKSRLDLMANYVFYQNENNPKGACYLEATYKLDYNAKLFVGYVTGPSAVNFQSKAGFTNIGVHITRDLNFSSKLSVRSKLTISVNPNYKTVMTASTVPAKPLNTVLTLTF